MDRNLLLSNEAHRLHEHLDAPTFTCEVCKISVRSAQKLLDHVQYSPLHQASLGLGKSLKVGDGSKNASELRRLLYDGSELFWRINETLDLCIFEDKSANCVTIQAFQQNASQTTLDDNQKKISTEVIPALDVNRSRLREILGLEKVCKVSGYQGKMIYSQMSPMLNTTFASKTRATAESSTSEQAGELIAKYLLARLQARRDSDDRVSLFLQKANDDEIDPEELLLAIDGSSHEFPTDLVIRRRHTIDDVKFAQKEMSVATTRLKSARIKAEELVNITRKTLDAMPRSNG